MLAFGVRNVMRNRRRSLLACASVFLSIAMIVILQGFVSGFMDSLVRNYTKNETGHVNVATSGYRDRVKFSPTDEWIEGSDALADTILSALGGPASGARIAQRIRFGVLLSSGPSTKQAVGIAGDPGAERGLLMLDTRILPGGGYIEGPGDAILGEGLASDLGLKPGDPLKVVAQKSDGGIGFRKFRVAGIFRTGVNSMDGSVFQVGLADARTLLGMEGGAQQILAILPRRGDTAKAAEKTLAALGGRAASAGGDLSVLPWTSIGDYPRLVAMMEAIMLWVWLVVALLGAFIIANVMTMAVLERKREIGILMSMGMPAGRIRSLFLLEGSMLGFAGALAGAAAGTAFNLAFRRAGFDLTASMAGFSWPMDNVIHPSADIGSALLMVALGTLVAALVSWIPARNAARMPPAEAIRAA